MYYDELLAKDWLGRDTVDYTYTKEGVDIGWEKTLLKDEPISKFLLRANYTNLSTQRAIIMTKQACNSLMSRMNPIRKKLNVVFSEDLISYQAGNTICVTLEPLGDKIDFPSFNHRLDPILGFLVHEVAHYLYTDINYDNYLSKFSGFEGDTKRFIMNTLEDERIEQLVAKTFRGYIGYIGKAKDYCFGRKLTEALKDNEVNLDTDLSQLMYTFIHLLRYPKALDRVHVDKFERPIREIIEVLTPYPSTTTDLGKVSELIYDIILNYAPQQSETSTEPEFNDSEGGKEPEEGKESEVINEEGKKQKKNSKKKSKKDKSGKNGESSEVSNDDSTWGDDSNNSKSDTSLSSDVVKLIAAIKAAQSNIKTSEELAEIIQKSESDYGVEQAIIRVSRLNQEDISEYQSYTHKYPITANLHASELAVKFIPSKKLAHESTYDRSLPEVKTYAASLRAHLQKLNRNFDKSNIGLYEGDFDQDYLVEAVIGSKNTYKEDVKVVNRGACIALLIDESGSMNYGDRSLWFEAQKIAVMFERALDGCNNIDFYCYGHTTDKSFGASETYTKIHVYYEGKKNSDRKALGKIAHYNGNRDGHAILETVGRIRSMVSIDQPIIMFVVSDGEPSSDVPYGYNGKTYTKKCVDTVEQYSNASVIHIAITEGIPSSEMFNKYIALTEPEKLVVDIGKVLKNEINKNNKLRNK